MNDMETTLALLCQRMTEAEKRHAELAQVVMDEKKRLNGNLERLVKWMQDMTATIGEYRMELKHAADAKPSWFVALAITTLTSICTALAVYTLTH